MRHFDLLAVSPILAKYARWRSFARERSFLSTLILLVICNGAVTAVASEAIQQQISKIEQSHTVESTRSMQLDLAGRTEKYEIEKFSMAYCDQITTFRGGSLTLTCNPSRTEVSMIVVGLYAPASGIRTAYKRGTLLAKTEKKDFRGWIRQSDPRYFVITPPKGLNEMLALGKGLSPQKSVTMALYADHTSEPVPQENQPTSIRVTTRSSPISNSVAQVPTKGDSICINLPYDDLADNDTYGQPHVLEAEIGSNQAKFQLRCDPEVRQLQAVRIVMAESVALATSESINEKGTAVVRIVTLGESDARAIVTEWTYQQGSNNRLIFSPKRQIDERDIYGFFESGTTREALMKIAFVNEANNMSQALESASAIPISLLDKTQRRGQFTAELDDSW